jgi:hypothetical protein
MENLDDMFDKYFGDYDFKSEEEKEATKSLFFKVMENFKENQNDISKLFESIYNFPFMKSNSEVQEMINEYNMNLYSVKVNKTNKLTMVNETWKSKDEGYMMDITYVLNKLTFSGKDDEYKEMLIEELTNSNLISQTEINDYLSEMPVEKQIKYYTDLMNIAVENENYEEAAMYRDIIKDLS